ncbi:MAG: holo-ACP synthase [Candidatus Cloacimonadaceae bacterium]|nr:holo-ACP synthase [Candidatus Cloacimonadaceae bacterium]
MILGIGTDIIDIRRIKHNLELNPRFAERIFTAREIEYCQSRASSHCSFAVRFAAKEAVMKALGTGWDGKVNWIDIEILNSESGTPAVFVYNYTKELMDQKRVIQIHISLSHEKDYATAMAILEG